MLAEAFEVVAPMYWDVVEASTLAAPRFALDTLVFGLHVVVFFVSRVS